MRSSKKEVGKRDKEGQTRYKAKERKEEAK